MNAISGCFAAIGYMNVCTHVRAFCVCENWTIGHVERCIREMAVGRKAFLFVGSERARHAAAIYYSMVQSCKANQVNPLTYLTYVLSHARDKSVQLPTPDEFANVRAAPAGGVVL
jgi:hypothetical protein